MAKLQVNSLIARREQAQVEIGKAQRELKELEIISGFQLATQVLFDNDPSAEHGIEQGELIEYILDERDTDAKDEIQEAVHAREIEARVKGGETLYFLTRNVFDALWK